LKNSYDDRIGSKPEPAKEVNEGRLGGDGENGENGETKMGSSP